MPYGAAPTAFCSLAQHWERSEQNEFYILMRLLRLLGPCRLPITFASSSCVRRWSLRRRFVDSCCLDQCQDSRTMDNRCVNRVATGASVGAALGASIGTCSTAVIAPRWQLSRCYDTMAQVIDGAKRPVCAGALYGTYEAFRYKVRQAVLVRDCCLTPGRCVCTSELCVDFYGSGFAAQVPGIYKIRYVGQTTLSSAAVRAVGCSRLPTVTCLKHARWRCLWPAGVWALPWSWIPAALREVAGATDGRCRPRRACSEQPWTLP